MKATKFYKEKKTLVKYCKAQGCQEYFRPEIRDWYARLGYCPAHRKIYYRNWHINVFTPWFMKQSPEVQDRYRKMRKGVWDKWVVKNLLRRRAIALRSYHKHKQRINFNRRAKTRSRKQKERLS